jgi:hypothetical protein
MVPRVAGGGRGANSLSQNVVADAVGSYTFLNYGTVLDQEKNYIQYVFPTRLLTSEDECKWF